MEVNNPSETSDEALSRVAELMAARAKPLRLRIPLMLWNGKNYEAWRQESWKIDVADAAEARELKDGMDCFFATASRCGIQRTIAALRAEQEQPE